MSEIRQVGCKDGCECGYEEAHKRCKCVKCGETWPNRDWRESAQPSAKCNNPNHYHVDGSPALHEIGPSCMAEAAQPEASPRHRTSQTVQAEADPCPFCGKARERAESAIREARNKALDEAAAIAMQGAVWDYKPTAMRDSILALKAEDVTP